MFHRLALTTVLIAIVLSMAMCTAPAPTATARPTSTPLPLPTATLIPAEKQEARVLRVIDGDTIIVDLQGKQYRVRYIGIDTPETHHPDDGADYWGFEATDANRQLVPEGSIVVLQRDLSETDIYGRLLRYIWVDDVLINAELVRMGLARVLFYEPDVLYQSEIKAAEKEAQEARRGLYGPVPTPPAKKPLLYKGTVWTVSSSEETITLYDDPAFGGPETYFPAGVQTRLVDVYWVPDVQEWWYWIGINGFNGWTNEAFISRSAPEKSVEAPPVWINAYDNLEMADNASIYGHPGQDSDVVAEFQAGTAVQVRNLSWASETGMWWYYVESTEGAGWITVDKLSR
ncbi:MAG: thermonuclease family protein [Anaerolineae bacterium]|nr:thermonuclease family protein [Anaerolineae bacterium]